jgi:predicted phage terminase large subunit-like protein
MNTEFVLNKKQELGTYVWESQYQQEPCPLEGGIIKEPWLHYYDQETVERISPFRYWRIFISWDTACKTGTNNDYSACCVMLMTCDSKMYLLDVVRGRWEFPELLNKAKEIYNHWKHERRGDDIVKMLIEDKSSGTQLIQNLNTMSDSKGYGFDIESIKPDGDKIARLYGASAPIENGKLLFPSDSQPWWADFKKELLSVPGSKHDDQVDALTQCVNFAQSMAN